MAVAVLAPAAATGLALPFTGHGPAVPALLYLLGVVVAAALGRSWSGLGAALLSFIGLNFFFTVPRHTLRVTKTDDLIALLIFLLVSAIVGTLLTRALEERARAQSREEETRLLYSLALRIRSGDPLDKVLNDFAGAMLETFALARCEVRANDGGGVSLNVSASAGDGDPAEAAPSMEVPLAAGTRELGSLVVTRPPGAPPFSRADREILTAIASQAALALERARLDEEIRGARLDSEANEARAALFSSVTHDLRTPLASIKAGVSSLLQPDVSYDAEQERDLLQTVLEETDRLNRLVGNILDLARVRARALEPAKTTTSLEDVIEAVLARMGPRLKGFSVRTILRPDLPDIPMDPVQIDQVMTNLIENAVRFSPPGGEILISVAPWRSAQRVRVADQGPGIPAEDRERVFEAFHRGEAGDGHTGTGLGLAIARAVIEAHGGRIWIEGAPGGGAAVVFDIPAGDRI